jgi:hypothetical protein
MRCSPCAHGPRFVPARRSLTRSLTRSHSVARPMSGSSRSRSSLDEAIRTRGFAAIAAKSAASSPPCVTRPASRRASPTRPNATTLRCAHVLACLIANGCPGRDKVYEYAAQNGSALEVPRLPAVRA